MMLVRLYVRYIGLEKKDVRGINDARHSLFMKAKRELDVLPPSHGALELLITRANFLAKLWLQPDHVIMDLENKLLRKLLTCGKKVKTD